MSKEGEWGSRIDHFMATRQISQGSKSSYEVHLRKFQTWCDAEGLKTPEAVSVSAMARYYSIQAANFAPSTVAGRFGVLRIFYEWLVSEGVCDSSPLRSLKFSQPVASVRDTLSIEQMKRLWQTATSPLDRATVALLGINSLRHDEVAKARAADLGVSMPTEDATRAGRHTEVRALRQEIGSRDRVAQSANPSDAHAKAGAQSRIAQSSTILHVTCTIPELRQPLARVVAGQGPFRARGRYWDRISTAACLQPVAWPAHIAL